MWLDNRRENLEIVSKIENIKDDGKNEVKHFINLKG